MLDGLSDIDSIKRVRYLGGDLSMTLGGGVDKIKLKIDKWPVDM